MPYSSQIIFWTRPAQRKELNTGLWAYAQHILRDEMVKLSGIIKRHGRMMQEMGEQLVQLTLERDRGVLELDTVRAQNEELRARLAEYGQSRHTTTSTRPRPEKPGRTPTGDGAGCSATCVASRYLRRIALANSC